MVYHGGGTLPRLSQRAALYDLVVLTIDCEVQLARRREIGSLRKPRRRTQPSGNSKADSNLGAAPLRSLVAIHSFHAITRSEF